MGKQNLEFIGSTIKSILDGHVNDKDNRNRRLRAERINGKTTYRVI